MRIDSHHHFWQYNPEQFGWLKDGLSPLRRDYMPADLESVIASARVDGVITVQTMHSVEESAWMLDLAAKHPFISGVVGWVPLISPGVQQQIEQLTAHPSGKFLGVRHVLQAEPDAEYMLREDFNAGVRQLTASKLVYDILIYERHLANTIKFVDRHPNHVFVLDHIAKPRIAEHIIEPWATHIQDLARRQNVYCKVSGMVTEADFQNWTPADLRPYWEVVLEAFSPQRLMFGSDWPVCLAACEYQRWVDTLTDFAAELSASEQARLFGGTACEAYRLNT